MIFLILYLSIGGILAGCYYKDTKDIPGCLLAFFFWILVLVALIYDLCRGRKRLADFESKIEEPTTNFNKNDFIFHNWLGYDSIYRTKAFKIIKQKRTRKVLTLTFFDKDSNRYTATQKQEVYFVPRKYEVIGNNIKLIHDEHVWKTDEPSISVDDLMRLPTVKLDNGCYLNTTFIKETYIETTEEEVELDVEEYERTIEEERKKYDTIG